MILPLQTRLLTTLKDADALSALCGRLDEAGIRYRVKARNRKRPLPPSRGLPLGAGAGLELCYRVYVHKRDESPARAILRSGTAAN